MKQDYGMFFFACFVPTNARPPYCIRLCPFSQKLSQNLSVRFELFLVSDMLIILMSQKEKKHSNFGVNQFFFFFILVCITPWGHIVLFCISSSWFVYFFCLDRLQHHNMKWCWQCTSLFFHHLATIVDGLYLKSIYCTKKWEGGKTVCAIKNTKIQFSHLRSGPIHISRVWYT